MSAPSPTIVIPDLLLSCRALLRGQAARVSAQVAAYITELLNVYILPYGSLGWIETFIPNYQQLPRNAIKLSTAGGTGTFSRPPGLEAGRVQFDCYGRTAGDAAAIAFLVRAILDPIQYQYSGWVAENTLVTQPLAVTGPLPGVDPDVKSAVATYRTVSADLEFARLAVTA